MAAKKTRTGPSRLDDVVAKAQRNRLERERGYREQALKMYPWFCGRCRREFNSANLHELTVHHRDHDHDNNPPDGSNWELLCLYCHDNEHARYVDAHGTEPPGSSGRAVQPATHKPFAELESLLKRKD